MDKPKTILIADDNPDDRLLHAHQVKKAGYTPEKGYKIEFAESADEAVDLHAKHNPVLTLLDCDMPKTTTSPGPVIQGIGFEVIDKIHQVHPTTTIVMVSGGKEMEQGKRTRIELAQQKTRTATTQFLSKEEGPLAVRQKLTELLGAPGIPRTGFGSGEVQP